MNQRKERRLLCIRRTVPEADEELYRTLWAQLGAMVRESGSHAWRFVDPDKSRSRLEFLEFEAVNDPRRDSGAAGLLSRLDREIAPAEVEEWLEER